MYKYKMASLTPQQQVDVLIQQFNASIVALEVSYEISSNADGTAYNIKYEGPLPVLAPTISKAVQLGFDCVALLLPAGFVCNSNLQNKVSPPGIASVSITFCYNKLVQ
jgi:hypothetical protein